MVSLSKVLTKFHNLLNKIQSSEKKDKYIYNIKDNAV